MPQLAVAAWTAFSTAATAAATAVTASLTAAGISAGIAGTIGTIAGYVQVASQVIGGVQAVASALGVGQKQPQLRGIWEQNRLTVDASASRKLIVGRTAISGSMRAQFQVGKYKDWFWQTVALSGAGPIESLDGVVIERVTYTINGNGQCSYAPNDMQVFFRNGAWNQTAITSFPLRNASETPQGQWTANHRGAGIAHVLWVARENPKVFTKGKPQPLWLVKGQTDLIDPRTGTTAGAAHRDNPAVWEYTWRLGFKSPSGYGSVELGGFQKSVDQLDTATYAAWANRCEALGWKVSGEIDLNEDREAVSRAFCQAGAAVPIVKGGKDSVFYQSVKTSLMTLTEADFVGDIEIQTSPEIRDRANGIIPRFRSEAHGWEQVAGSLITATSYVTEDGGSRIAEVQFPLVVSATQAGQLSAYQMVQSRERLLLRGPIHPRILAVGPGEAVTINVPSRGISNVKFIMEGRSIGTDGAITCSFRSETDSKHTYATGQSSTVPDTSLPGLSDGTIDAPTAGAWTASVAQITSGATSLPIIRVTGAVESFRVAAILIRYRTTAGPGPWNNLAPANRDATRIEIDTVTPNTSYDLEVSYISVTGTESAWTSLGTLSTGTFVAGAAGTAGGIVGQGPWATETTPVGVVTLGNPNLIKDSSFLAGVGSSFSSNWSSTGGWYRQDVLGLGSFAQIVANGTQVITTADFETVSAGQVFSLQAEFRCGGLAAAAVCLVDIIWTNNSGLAGIIGYSTPVGLNGAEYAAAFATSKPGGWVRRTSSTSGLVAPTGATRAYVRAYVVGTNTDSGVRNIKMEQGTVCTLWTDDKLKPRESGADITGGNTAAGFIGQGNQATTNIYRQATAPTSPQEGDIWEDTSTNPVSIRRRISGAWVFQGEEGADITAQAVPSLEGPSSVTFDVDAVGALNPGSQVPRTLQFVRKRGNVDVSTSTTWSIVSPVNVTLGTITNGGVNITAIAAGNSAFTVRSVRDGVTIDMLVTVVKNTIAAGVISATRKQIQSNSGTPNNGNWTDVASMVIPATPTGNLFFNSSFASIVAGTGTCSHEARLTVDGVQVGAIQAAQATVTGGVPEAVDFGQTFAQVIPVTAGSRTIAFQLRRTTGAGQITTSAITFDVAAFPG